MAHEPHLKVDNKQHLIRRLRTVAGHIKGIEKMIEEDKYCVDILMQISAVQASLNKVSDQVLESHLHTCVSNAIKSGDENILDELMDVLKYRQR